MFDQLEPRKNGLIMVVYYHGLTSLKVNKIRSEDEIRWSIALL